MSLVVHLSLVLLLAFVQAIGDGGLHDARIELDCETNGPDGLGDDALLAAAIELPSELTPAVHERAELPQEAALATPLDVSSKIQLLDASGKTQAFDVAAPDEEAGDPGSARTAVFGLAAEGERFVYVFDRSESMNSTLTYSSQGTTVFSITPLSAAKAELLRSLEDLDRHQRFHILFYNHEVWMFDAGRASKSLVAGTPENKRRAASFVAGVYGYGNTRHVKPLEVAIGMRPDVIFLLTDGEAKDDPTEDQLARLRRLNRAGTKINVIQFCLEPRTDSTLVRLAQENDGRHIFMSITRLGPGMAGVGPQLAQ